jgi:hypothetical protein
MFFRRKKKQEPAAATATGSNQRAGGLIFLDGDNKPSMMVSPDGKTRFPIPRTRR